MATATCVTQYVPNCCAEWQQFPPQHFGQYLINAVSHQFASFKKEICLNIGPDVAQLNSLKEDIVSDIHVHFNDILRLSLHSLKKEVHNEFTNTLDSYRKELDKKINLLFGSTLSDHAETIMLTNKVDYMPSLMDLILKEHEESFTKTLCDSLKPIFGQLTDVYKDFCGSQRKTLKTISAEMISLAKQFESNIVTSYKDATSRLKDLSEGLDPLQYKIESSLSTASELSKQFDSFSEEIRHDVGENFGTFSKQLSTVEKAIHDIESFNKEIRRDIDEKFSQFSEQLSSVEKEVNENITACGSLDKKLNNRLSGHFSFFEKEMNKCSDRLNGLSEWSTKLNDGLTDQFSSFEKEMTQLNDRFDSMSQKFELLQKDINDFKHEFTSGTNEIDSVFNAAKTDICAETSDLKSEFASCAIQLNSIFDSAKHDIKHGTADLKNELAFRTGDIKQAFANHNPSNKEIINVTMRDAVTQIPICVPDSGDEMQMSSDVNTSVDDLTSDVSMVAADARTSGMVQTSSDINVTSNDYATSSSNDVFCTSDDHARHCDNIAQLPAGYTSFNDVISPSIDVCQTSLSDASLPDDSQRSLVCTVASSPDCAESSFDDTFSPIDYTETSSADNGFSTDSAGAMSADRPCAIERPGYSIASNNRTKRKSKRRNANNKAKDLRKSSYCARGRRVFDKDSFWNDRRNNAVQNTVPHDSLQNPHDSITETPMHNDFDSGETKQTTVPENGSRRVPDDCQNRADTNVNPQNAAPQDSDRSTHSNGFNSSFDYDIAWMPIAIPRYWIPPPYMVPFYMPPFWPWYGPISNSVPAPNAGS